MDPLLPKVAYVVVTVAMFVLRMPYIRRSGRVAVVRDEVGPREVVLVALVGVGLLFLPLLWLLTPWLEAADYPPISVAFDAGLLVAGLGLVVLWRAHHDLGANWSNTLQVREGHALVTTGIYAHVRHPMYLGLLLHALGQALFLPNLVAGPAYLVAFGLLVACRLGSEERLMEETFGEAWTAYRAQTSRLIPGIY